MRYLCQLLSAVVLTAIFAASAVAAETTAPKPSARQEAVFKSLQSSTQGPGISVPMRPLALAAAGAVLMTIAVKQWNRRKTMPKPLSNHRKLLGEAARAAGLSKRKLKRLAPLAQADGLSSPLVAMICPSAIKRLAKVVKTAEEQEALKSMAETLFRAEAKARRNA